MAFLGYARSCKLSIQRRFVCTLRRLCQLTFGQSALFPKILFLSSICTDSDDSKLVSAVINLGRSFNLQVIAEGVETREQFIALQAQNCAEGQGYYFQKPIVANEFAKLLGADLATTVAA